MQLTYTGKHRYELPSFQPELNTDGMPIERVRYVMDKKNPSIEYPYWDRIKGRKPVKYFVENGLLVVHDGSQKQEQKTEVKDALTFKVFSEKDEKSARKWVARSNDLKTLKLFLEKETRESVKESIQDRIETLSE